VFVEIQRSLSNNQWQEKKTDHNKIEKLSQKKSISNIFSKLLVARGINENNLDQFLNPDITTNIPDPFTLKDMQKAVDTCLKVLVSNSKIGIIADYDDLLSMIDKYFVKDDTKKYVEK